MTTPCLIMMRNILGLIWTSKRVQFFTMYVCMKNLRSDMVHLSDSIKQYETLLSGILSTGIIFTKMNRKIYLYLAGERFSKEIFCNPKNMPKKSAWPLVM